MKKLFVFMSAMALVASCTNEDFESNENATPIPAKGIVFETSGMESSPVTRGYIDVTPDGTGFHDFKFRWNAEKDRIGIIAVNAIKGYSEASVSNANCWGDVSGADRTNSSPLAAQDVHTGVAVYKATTTGNRGYWTGVDDNNILKFDGKEKASFLAFYPAGTVSATNDALKYSNNNASDGTPKEEKMLLALANDDAAQTQATTAAPFENFTLIAEPIVDASSETNSVGEVLNLKFQRPFVIGAFSVKNYNESTYGKLEEITITMSNTNTKIAHGDDATIDLFSRTITPGTATNEIVLTVGGGVGSGLSWSDDYFAYVQMLPVARAAAEKYSITYKFANMTFKNEYETSAKSWDAGAVLEFEPLDFNKIEYVVTGSASDYSLTINDGCTKTIAAMLSEDGDKVVGNDGNEVALTDIKTVVSNKVLDAADLATLKNKFTVVTSYTLANQSADLGDNLANLATGVTSLTLSEATTAPVITSYPGLATLSCPKATTVPANAYKDNKVITRFDFPSVQTIGANAFNGCSTNIVAISQTAAANTIAIGDALTKVEANAFAGLTGLKTIDAPKLSAIDPLVFGYNTSYSFEKVILPAYAFTEPMVAVQLLTGALTEVDLSSVEALGGNNIVALARKANLTTVTLKDGVKIGLDAFNGCTSLATVKNLNKAAEIGVNAFNECAALGGSIKFEKTIAAIGANAFNGTAITAFDFTGVTTIGEGAFSGTKLTEITLPSVTVLEKDVFKGVTTAATLILDNVTTIEDGSLEGLTAAAPTIMFKKALTSISPLAFGSITTGGTGSSVDPYTMTSSYTLYVNRTQTDIKGKNLSVKSSDGKYYKITFDNIIMAF